MQFLENSGIISIGYVPEEPGICKITRRTASAFPMCLNVDASAKIRFT